MSKPSRFPLFLASLAVFVSACPSGTPKDGAGPVATVTQTVDAAGGTVSVGGATLVVPAGALATATAITVTATADAAPSGYSALSPIFRFEPDGLSFAQAVTVTLPWSGDANGAAIWWSKSGGGFERLQSTATGTTMTATVTHFCEGFVGRESESSGVDPNATLTGVAGICAVASDGTVRCWSDGYDKKPVPVAGVAGATQLAAGNAHYCARLRDGTVSCWGAGTGLTESPQVVAGLAGAAQVEARGDYTCARLDDGTVKCWGDNEFGQLGDGGSTRLATPFAVPLGAPAQEIALGLGHACARFADGTAKCWGSNMSGALGDGGPRQRGNPPVAVSGLSGALQLAAGGTHTCARLAERVVCWGLLLVDYGGVPVEAPQATPVEIAGLGQTAALALGDAYSCALLSGGDVRCWGRNASGELGDGTVEDRLAPVASRAASVQLLAVAGTAASGRLAFSFARKSDGSLWGWGRIPGGGTEPRPEPVRMGW